MADDYDPVVALTEEVDRFRATNTFTPMEVTNFYVQARVVLTENATLRRTLAELQAEVGGLRGLIRNAYEWGFSTGVTTDGCTEPSWYDEDDWAKFCKAYPLAEPDGGNSKG